MEAQAKLKHLRTSPKKVRLVADVIRGKNVADARHQLQHLNKGASSTLLKLLNSAIANAEHNLSLSKDNLFIKEIRVDGGAVLRRWMPRAHGRATPLRKKMSHIRIVLGEINPTKPKKSAKGGSASGGKKPVKVEVKKALPKNEMKDKIKNDVDAGKAGGEGQVTKEKPRDDTAPKGHEEEIDKNIIDPRMEGKHRHNQHSDKRGMKGHGGKTKKLFNRKAS